jgi:hypothetical protein
MAVCAETHMKVTYTGCGGIFLILKVVIQAVATILFGRVEKWENFLGYKKTSFVILRVPFHNT